MSNRLSTATSPYLLQHADNPVHWWPWCDEAFEEARRRDVPVFLSVGYSSCHWCHVMAHESFEDDETAAVLNERFVNVKVDREERPDVDAVYMDAITAMTGHGGWPMSVFLTPDTRRPFYGGTYWPKTGRPGMPAFLRILDAVHDAWTNRRDEVVESAGEITRTLQRQAASADPASGEAGAVDLSLIDAARDLVLTRAWDRERGGFGRAPKFPQAMLIGFLLDHHARTGHADALAAATQALDAMARGGIYDQVGGGFARYSTDANWLVPHFEKMLYDNGLLLAEYARAAVLTGSQQFVRVASETADYLLDEMRPDVAAFQAATDADSEGVEGRFFVWSRADLVAALRSGYDGADEVDAELVAELLGTTEAGNWEATNVLHEPVARHDVARRKGLDPDVVDRMLAVARRRLYEVRAQRVPPSADGKVLASWNGLAIRGLALAGRHLGQPRWTDAAAGAAGFLREHLVVDGRLHHSWHRGEVGAPAFLDDHADLALGLLALYEATGDVAWFRWARDLAEQARERFRDVDRGGYHDTAVDAESLYLRPKAAWDNATPSGNSALAAVAVRLAAYTGDAGWDEVAREIVALRQADVVRGAVGQGLLLQVMEWLAADGLEVAIVGPPGDERDLLVAEVAGRILPATVLAVSSDAARDGEVVPLLAHRTTVDGAAAAYVCRQFSCRRPVTTPGELAGSLT